MTQGAALKGGRRQAVKLLWMKKSEDNRELARDEPQRAPTFPPKGKKKEPPRPDARFAPLLRAVWAVAENEDLLEHAETLARELEVSVEWVLQMALVEFIEGHGRDEEGYGDRLRRASPYWQTHKYTDDEIDALLKADEFSPEDAELYKDLLED